MSALDSDACRPHLHGFIDRLKRRGFTVGVDGHIRAEAVLRHLGPTVRPTDLRYLLCPLFATDADQQDRFHREFDRYFGFLGKAEAAPAPAAEAGKTGEVSPKPPVWARRWPYLVAGVIIILVCVGLIYLGGGEPMPKVDGQAGGGGGPGPPPPVEPGETITITLSGQPPEPPPEPDPPTWWQRYGGRVRTLLLFAPWLVWLLVEWYHHRRKRLALMRGRTRKPPYTYTLHVKPPEAPFFRGRRFRSAANALRTRLPGEIRQPDVPATIRETVEGGGYPALRYKTLTRPPEYLFLIDLTGPRDHGPRFMESLAGALEDEGIFVTRYYFRDDPRVVFPEPGGRRVRLDDIRSKYARCRLVIAGTGDGLLDPLTGDLDAWTDALRFWPDRAVLTGRPPRQWGMREVTLAREFILLPASIDGLAALTDHFDGADRLDLKAWVRADRREGPPVPKPDAEVPELRKYLGGTAFQWLCACAVYPELHWNLTLHLIAFLDRPITAEDVVRLIRLPHFKAGSLPEALRGELLAHLDPDRYTKVRAEILNVLKKNPPPPDSGAWDGYQLNLALHGRLLTREQKRRLRESAANISGARLRRDYTLLRVLESERASPLALRLPRWVQKLFFKGGLPLFGLKSGVRVAVAVLAFALVWWSVPVPEPYTIPTPVSAAGEDKAVEMTFAYIPPGEFTMGSPEDEPGRDSDETLHEVILTEGFYMQTTEVTQAQWAAVMGRDSSGSGIWRPEYPVEDVTWYDARSFLDKLNQRGGEYEYRLPTEAEWEYAARAGTETAFYNGEITKDASAKTECITDPNLDKIGWYCANSNGTPHPVAQKNSNSWGLYDMSGNAWEWCADWYGDYPPGPVTDPTGPWEGSSRVLRGGGWNYIARYCRSAYRSRSSPSFRYNRNGFRLALSPGR